MGKSFSELFMKLIYFWKTFAYFYLHD